MGFDFLNCFQLSNSVSLFCFNKTAWIIKAVDTNVHGSRFKDQGSLIFVTYTIIQGIISSEM